MWKNKLIRMFFVLTLIGFTFMIGFNVVYAVDSVVEPSGGSVHNGFETRGYKIWNTVELILRTAAIVIFLFTGIKYMYSSADQKADLKKGLTMTFIGVAIVFGMTYVIDFINGVATQLF